MSGIPAVAQQSYAWKDDYTNFRRLQIMRFLLFCANPHRTECLAIPSHIPKAAVTTDPYEARVL